MNKRIISISVLLSLLTTSLIGQVISTPDARSGLLVKLDNSLNNMERAEGNFSEMESPFVGKLVKEVVEVVEVVEEPVVGARLPDDQALSVISERFSPLGSLVLGNRGVLQLPDNQTIEKGATFTAEITGNIYEVLILNVTTKGYTLQLGTAQISKNFLTTSGTAE